jgi:transient receptor potential cation channel subfamily M protein 7
LFFRETFLDKKILSALLKGNNMDLHTQLYLAMIWDRVDLAEEKILAGGSLIGVSSVNDVMIDALIFERSSFIELLVMNGFVMRSFLTVDTLRELYNKAVSFTTVIHSHAR